MSERDQSTQVGADHSPQAGTDATQAGGSDQRSEDRAEGQAPSSSADAQRTQQRPRSEAERLRQEAEEARREAARYRTELRQFQDRDLSEQQRLQRDHDELRTQHQTATQRVAELEHTVQSLNAQIFLSSVGCTRPALLASRITPDDLASDESKAAIVKTLKKEVPELFGPLVRGSADGANEGSTVRRGSTMNDLIRARVGQTPA